jgi:hypothetical protein
MIPANLPLIAYRGTSFGQKFICKDSNQVIVDINGWTAFALVRVAPQKHIVLDLAPTITNGAGGEVSISFTDEQTLLFPPGEFVWDFVLQRPTGEKLGPFLAGTFSIKTANSRG